MHLLLYLHILLKKLITSDDGLRSRSYCCQHT